MQLKTEMATPQQPDQQNTTTARQSQSQGQGQGLLFVLSAPSGTGKDSVIAALKARGIDFHVVSSVTTRAPRPGESEGKPYYFVSQEAFEHMVANNALLEHANVHGNWYGQPLQQINENLQQGRDVLLKIDVQGAATVRQKLPGAIFIFLIPGSVEELVERLTQRQTENAEQRQRRLADAQIELAQSKYYDYVIENHQGKMEEAVEDLCSIIRAEHRRSNPRYVQLTQQ